MRRIDGLFRQNRPLVGRTAVYTSPLKLAGILMLIALVTSLTLWSSRPAGAAVDLVQLIKDGRYMVAFQNNTELRPSGGFLGSFAIVEVKNRRLTSYWFETNIYKMDNEFSKRMMIPPPQPLADSWPGRSWALNSANWSVDFFEAASTMKWFYELEYQDTIDGLVAVNATTISDLLKVLGPIPLPQYDLVITADNFLKEVQWQVEKEYFEKADQLMINEPKTILKDLMVEILSRIRQGTNPVSLWDLAQRSLVTKDIQLAFFNHPTAQAIAQKRNWAGRVSTTEGNEPYLLINNANLHGGKGSLGVRQTVRYDLDWDELGQPVVDLTITRVNEGRTDGWVVGENRNFTRVLVPLGSQLVGATLANRPIEDLRVELEADKTSFGFWFTTPLHQARVARLRYRMPRSSQPWPLIYQHQSGSPPDQVEIYNRGQPLYVGTVDRDLTID